jgi:hypothetical protein
MNKRKALIGCLSWHRLLCGDDAHTISIRMVWVKCTTSAECKSIRIAVSAVMDGWDGRCLAVMPLVLFKKVFMGKGKRKWFGVPMGVLPWKISLD